MYMGLSCSVYYVTGTRSLTTFVVFFPPAGIWGRTLFVSAKYASII